MFDNTIQYKDPGAKPGSETAPRTRSRYRLTGKASDVGRKNKAKVWVAAKASKITKKTRRAHSATSEDCITITTAMVPEVSETANRSESVPSTSSVTIKSVAKKRLADDVESDNDSANPPKRTRSGA